MSLSLPSVLAQAGAVNALDHPGPAWSPYLAGALIGVLVLVMLSLADKPLGASSGYAQILGNVLKPFAPRHVEELRYFREKPPRLDWSLVFVPAIAVGAFLAAWTGGELTGRLVPPLWAERFGPDAALSRVLVTFGGGLMIAFGARLAGGCTSGHGISGTLQLSAGSWVSLLSFFAGGAIGARFLYVW